MKILINADDLGLSKGITDSIIDCVDHGCINRISMIVNGAAFDYAVEQTLRRPSLGVALHLNFCEGHAVSPAREVDQLVTCDGAFRHSFQSLWCAFLIAGNKKRQVLRQQIRREMILQIHRFQDAFGHDRPIEIDSHRHYHLIPFVFDELLALAAEYSVEYIRLPREPSFRPPRSDCARFPIVDSNLVKHVLLNRLSAQRPAQLAARGIETADWFVGIRDTGRMTRGVVAAALNRIQQLGGGDLIEILFHPGAASEDEAALWSRYPAQRAYYYSSWRHREAQSLRSGELSRLLDQVAKGVPVTEIGSSSDER